MKSQAETLVALCNFHEMSVDEIDALEPWTWADNDAVDTVDDNGEDFTAVFADGSRARWVNSERAWEVVK